MTDETLNWQKRVGETISVKVTPKASANRIKPEVMPDGTLRIRVYVTTIAEGGKANEVVLKLLAKSLHCPKSSLRITRGLLSQEKLIQKIKKSK